MRISSLALLLALAACGGPQGKAAPGDAIECALDGAATFAKSCTVERVDGGIVVHRPDGGFRRFQAADDRVTALDGADPVTVTPQPGGSVELGIDGDRYCLALTDPGNAPKP